MPPLVLRTAVALSSALLLGTALLAMAPSPAAPHAPAGWAPTAITTDPTEADTTEADTTQRRADVAADSLVATMVDSVRVQQLFRNVRVEQDSTRIRSEQAVRYVQQREYLFSGNVVIFERGDTLKADTVRYDEQRKIGRARGNVRLTDGDLRVQAPAGQYFATEKRSVFQEGVTLIDSASTLTSRAGEYLSDEERAEFYGDVRFENADTYLEADSVTYWRDTGNTLARGRVFIRRKGDAAAADADTTTQTYLFGDVARNEKTRNESRVRGRALLVQVRADSVGAPTDTLLVRAHRLYSTRSDSLRRLVAIDSVRIWQQAIAATADSVVYDRTTVADTLQREETRLYRDPISWFEGAQVTGDTIVVKARNRAVDTVHVYGRAFAAQRDTTIDRIHQLQGKTITAFFRNDSLRRIEAKPNARTIRFMKDGQGRLARAVQASSDRIVLWFRAGDIRRAGLYSGVQSQAYGRGLAPIPDPFRLDGFRWVPEQQPTKEHLVQDERVRRRLRGNVVATRPVSPSSAESAPRPPPARNQ